VNPGVVGARSLERRGAGVHHQDQRDRAQCMSDPEGLVGYVFLDEPSTRLWREIAALVGGALASPLVARATRAAIFFL
jgi:hypothetical protein